MECEIRRLEPEVCGLRGRVHANFLQEHEYRWEVQWLQDEVRELRKHGLHPPPPPVQTATRVVSGPLPVFRSVLRSLFRCVFPSVSRSMLRSPCSVFRSMLRSVLGAVPRFLLSRVLFRCVPCRSVPVWPRGYHFACPSRHGNPELTVSRSEQTPSTYRAAACSQDPNGLKAIIQALDRAMMPHPCFFRRNCARPPQRASAPSSAFFCGSLHAHSPNRAPTSTNDPLSTRAAPHKHHDMIADLMNGIANSTGFLLGSEFSSWPLPSKPGWRKDSTRGLHLGRRVCWPEAWRSMATSSSQASKPFRIQPQLLEKHCLQEAVMS